MSFAHIFLLVKEDAMTKKVLISFFVVVTVCVGVALAQDQQSGSAQGQSAYDDTKFFPLLGAFEGGTGWDSGSTHAPTSQAGLKLGFGIIRFGRRPPNEIMRTLTLDFQFDRSSKRNGFSTEGSLMLPIFRHPGPRSDENSNFLRVYAEPGFGHRSGGGDFGGYASAKVMLVLLTEKRLGLNRPSPFVEIQRRIPFGSPLSGDNRVTFGLMWALCSDCGVE